MIKQQRHCEHQRSNPFARADRHNGLPRRALALLAMTIMSLLLSACEHLPTSELLKFIKYERQIYVEQEVAKVAETVPDYKIAFGNPVFIRVIKNEALLEMWIQRSDAPEYVLYKTYPICSYSGQLGPKLAEGDMQAPEGFYTVAMNQLNPWSRYHLSFDLGFPNDYDAAWGRTGSHLMIHGGCESEGCYAITNEGIEEVYLLVEASISNGTDVPVHIFPFRMTAQAMHLHRNNQWIGFWQNLKQGYDLFEMTNVPPDYAVDATYYGPMYVFHSPVQDFRRMAAY